MTVTNNGVFLSPVSYQIRVPDEPNPQWVKVSHQDMRLRAVSVEGELFQNLACTDLIDVEKSTHDSCWGR
jgi:hypothetical protein